MTVADVLAGRAEYAIVRRLLAELVNDMTRGGHVAIRNERERTGYCSRRRCSKLCRERWALIEEAAAYLGAVAPIREALLAREDRPLFDDVPIRTEQLRMEGVI